MANEFNGILNSFDSYNNFERWLHHYEEEKKNKFNVFVSESLVKVYKKRDYVDFNPELIYDRIHYKCSIRAKHDKDMPNNCKSRLILSTSPHKRHLVVDDFVAEHNHPPPLIIGRRGSVKHRQLLLEAAVTLRETMMKRRQQIQRTVLPRNSENISEEACGPKKNVIMKEAVIRLSRINPDYNVDFGFIEFVDNLRPKVNLMSVLSNQLLLQPHHLLTIDKNNILNHLKFDLTKFKKYFSEPAFMKLQVLLVAKK